MAQVRSDSAGIRLHTPLFDRFERSGNADLQDLARDLADILGARRAISGSVPGVLNWGLTGIGDFSPASEQDRQQLAAQIASVVEMFEPRLSRIKVTPLDEGRDFRFDLEASLTQKAGRSIRLRILAPRRGGALGADVVLIGARD